MIRFLQQDSRLVKGIFIGLISITAILMVITLVPGIFQDTVSSGDNYAVVRGDTLFGRILGSSTDVHVTEVQQVAQRMQQQNHYPDFVMPFLMQRAGQALVQRAVLVEEAGHLGLTVTDNDVRNELMHGPFAPVLFPGGTFIGEDRYDDFVQNNFNMSRADFETQLKEEILINRLEALITGGLTVSNQAATDAYLKQATKVKFQYAVLSAAEVRKQINPSDAELKAFFQQNAARYAHAIPETRKVQYVAFALNQVPGGPPKVSDADIQRYYNEHQQQFSVPEEVRVRHILIAVPQNVDAKTVAAAQAKAEDILKQLKNGANFADLAKKYSDDPGSKTQGGELGFIQHGATVPAFDQAAFSLQPGQLSGVIHTQFGFHILQVEQKQPAHVKTVDEVHDLIMANLMQQAQAQAAQAYAAKLQAEAQQAGLQKMADQNHLQVVTADGLQQGGVVAGLADGTQLLKQAFTMKPDSLPATASTGEGYAVFKVLNVVPAHAPTFDAYKAHVLEDFRDQQIAGLMRSRTQQLAIKAKEEGLDKAAKEVGATLMTSDLVDSTGQVPQLGDMSSQGAVAFTLQPGQISGPIVTERTGVVLKVLDKQAPTEEQVKQNLDATRDKLVQQRRDAAFAVFATSLEQHYIQRGLIRYNKKALSNMQSGV
ncbi:MAG: peptidyl-prolyl cis-trans isomerase [Terriglobia bacterium]|nr:peptidyl-prolyl cis-trans isomerase [Terriglobia bacterium]